MSMILDALQRADRERQKQDQPLPSLDTPVAPPATTPTVPRLAWGLAGAGLGLALIVALAFIALNRSAPPAPQSSAREPAPVQAREPVASPQPAARPATETPTDTPPAAIAELYQSPQVEDESITALYRTAQRDDAPKAEETKRPIEGAEGHTQTLPERPEPSAVRLSEAKPESATAPSPATPETSPAIASVRDLPWNLQQTLPSINYQQHDYRSAGVSRVRINGKDYRAGQQVAQDLTLEGIEEDGAVMRYRGHRFKLRALNSWVNM